ncbi:MAG: DUF1015 domain-containing protein [Dehalococcoidales bacterium]|nr:DUF1015 domain-containing protein [Dehalococcoidales bacterium]
MAEIRPFRGVHYNQSRVDDWSEVICPVYDIITPQQREELYLRSDYNFVRLEHTRELPQDTNADNKYTRAAATLEQWLKQGVLEIDSIPAIYLHDQYFTLHGRKYRRRGIIVRVRLEEWERMIIRPHEGTLAEPRGDRLNLLWAIEANTSPILAMFEDPEQRLSSLLATQERNQPAISAPNIMGEAHVVRAITDPETIDQVCHILAEQPLYIADGHHRYESALAYRHESLARSPSASGDESFNFVMMTLVDFADPGLVILPPHRLARGISKSTLNELVPRLKALFEIEELPADTADLWHRVEGSSTEENTPRLVIFGLNGDCLSVLRLRDPEAASQMMPYFHSELYKKLDVSLVDHIILEKLLGIDSEKEKTSLAYVYDRQDAINRVTVQEYQLALLLKPVSPEVIKTIADVGDRMPRKSTYFYPKLPAGLIFNRLV